MGLLRSGSGWTLLVLGAVVLNHGCGDVAVVEPGDLAGGVIAPAFGFVGPAAGQPYVEGVCSTNCIEPGSGVCHVRSASVVSAAGVNAKDVSYVAYNTEDAFVVAVTYAIIAGRSRASASIVIDIAGDVAVFDDVPAGSTVAHRIALPADWQACDVISYSIRQEGLARPVEFADSYALVPVCPAVEPVLWNRLGSAAQVASSEVGPGGTIAGAVNFNNDVRDSKGITPNTGWAGSGVDFPTNIADPERGTVELWARFFDEPRGWSHGVFGLVNANHWTHNVLSFTWYNGWSSPSQRADAGYLQFVLQFNGTGRHIEYRPFDHELDVPVHLAIVWDRQGIAGSGDYMRIYVNGAVVAANSTQNDWGTSNAGGRFRVATTWDGSFATDRFALADIKVWDFAKTDFSDR